MNMTSNNITENKTELFNLLDTDIKTNIGVIPVLDYLDIEAYKYGFDSYTQFYQEGYRIKGYEMISPEVIEEWSAHWRKGEQ